MRNIRYILLFTVALLLSSCSFMDSENMAASNFVSSRDKVSPDQRITLSLTPANGIDAVICGRDTASWSSIAVSRNGFLEGDTFFSFLEFYASSVSGGVDSLNGRFATDSMREAFGIDSLSLDIFVVNGSAPSHGITGSGGLRLFRYSRNGAAVNLSENSLGDFSLSPYQIVAPADSGHLSFSIKRGSDLGAYRYFVDSMLIHRTADSIRIPVALLQRSVDGMFTLDPSRKAVLKYFGRSIKRIRAVTPDTSEKVYRDTLVRDSIVLVAKVSEMVARQSKANREALENNPSVTTYNCFSSENSSNSPVGKYRAAFDIAVDTIMNRLNPDSVVVLQSHATFFTANSPDSSFSEARQPLDFVVYCQLLDSLGAIVTISGKGLYKLSDTVAVYKSFLPWSDSSFTISINKQLVAMTDPLYKEVKSLRFVVAAANRPDRDNSDRIAKVIFRRRVAIDYRYEAR